MVIGVPSRYLYENNKRKQFINQTYIDALEKAGFIVIMIPCQKEVEKLFKFCDCFLLPGGGDINPLYYGCQDEMATNIENDLDELDFKIIEFSLKHEKPLVGICRGLQSINVFFNGTLSSNINMTHNNAEITELNNIDIQNFPFDIPNSIEINSYHHQGIDKIGTNLISIAKKDDVDEIIVHKNFSIIGLQFHPELMKNGWCSSFFLKWKKYIEKQLKVK